jgi:Fic family protein
MEDDMLSYSIYFQDLTKKAQKQLCEALHTTEKEENWDAFPLFIIERYAEDQEDPDGEERMVD